MNNDGRVEVVQHATPIRLLQLDAKPATVAETFHVSMVTVYRWWNRWREQGLEGLNNRPKQGRPTKTDAAFWQQLDATLQQAPRDLGYIFTVWTLKRLRDYLEKITGIRLNVE